MILLTSVTVPIASNLPGTTVLDLGSYVSKIIGVMLTVAAVAAFAYLVLGGINWITAGGEEKKIESARNRITGALVGLAIVAISWSIFLLLDRFFGLGIASGNSSGGSGSGGNSYPVGAVNPRCGCNQDLNTGVGPGMCARTGAVSPGKPPAGTFICDANSGWISTNKTWNGQVVDCQKCP